MYSYYEGKPDKNPAPTVRALPHRLKIIEHLSICWFSKGFTHWEQVEVQFLDQGPTES